jgi:hypothetical protein
MDTLMIHDVKPEYFDLQLDRFRLAFDDGLYTQYYYFPLFKNHPEKLIFFLTTAFIKPGKPRKMFAGRPISSLKTKNYMYRAFIEKDYSRFMTVEEIQTLSRQAAVRIGAHSHFHDVIISRKQPHKKKPLSRWKLERFADCPEIVSRNLSIRSKLAFQGFTCRHGKLAARTESEWEDYIKYDTELCLKWFEHNLDLAPDMYCFPFNEYNQKLISILKTFGFKTFFAARAGQGLDVEARVDIDALMKTI